MCRASSIGTEPVGVSSVAASWREPLSPIPVEGQVSATDPLALEGRGPAPDRGHPPSRASGGGAARRARRAHRRFRRGADRRRPPARPALAEPLAAPRRRRGLSDPRRADLAASPRPPRPLAGGLRLRLDRPRAPGGAGARARRPRRGAADQQGAAPLARRAAGDCASRARPARRLEGADPPRRDLVRADPADQRRARRATGARRASAERAPAGCGRGLAEADTAVREAVEAELDRLAGAQRARRLAGLAAELGDGDVVFAASSMPVRDMEAFVWPGRERVRFLSNRAPTASTGWSPPPPGRGCLRGRDLGGARRPRLGPRPGRPARPAAVESAPARARQRRRRHLPFPAPGRGPAGRRVRGAARHAGRHRPGRGRRALRAQLGPAGGPGRARAALAGDARVVVVRWTAPPTASFTALQRRLTDARSAPCLPAVSASAARLSR